MKEKTFEELIIHIIDDEGNICAQDVLKLLKQICEAKIAEVLKLADDNFFSKEPKGKLMENIENLPTDRIKIEE